MALALLLPLAGCSSPPEPVSDPLAVVPLDFSLEVVVLSGRGAEGRPEAHLRPGKWILFADGALHHGTEADRSLRGLPPVARILSRREMADVWVLARRLGLTNPARALIPFNFDLVEAPPGHAVYLVCFTGDGDRWSYRQDIDLDRSSAERVLTPLVRHLAALAWATDLPQDRIRLIPRRYDFGPDPYARYRTP